LGCYGTEWLCFGCLLWGWRRYLIRTTLYTELYMCSVVVLCGGVLGWICGGCLALGLGWVAFRCGGRFVGWVGWCCGGCCVRCGESRCGLTRVLGGWRGWCGCGVVVRG